MSSTCPPGACRGRASRRTHARPERRDRDPPRGPAARHRRARPDPGVLRALRQRFAVLTRALAALRAPAGSGSRPRGAGLLGEGGGVSHRGEDLRASTTRAAVEEGVAVGDVDPAGFVAGHGIEPTSSRSRSSSRAVRRDRSRRLHEHDAGRSAASARGRGWSVFARSRRGLHRPRSRRARHPGAPIITGSIHSMVRTFGRGPSPSAAPLARPATRSAHELGRHARPFLGASDGRGHALDVSKTRARPPRRRGASA